MNAKVNGEAAGMPDIKVSVKQLFGFDANLDVPAYSQASEHVPDLDEDYLFNRETTLAIRRCRSDLPSGRVTGSTGVQ